MASELQVAGSLIIAGEEIIRVPGYEAKLQAVKVVNFWPTFCYNIYLRKGLLLCKSNYTVL